MKSHCNKCNKEVALKQGAFVKHVDWMGRECEGTGRKPEDLPVISPRHPNLNSRRKNYMYKI